MNILYINTYYNGGGAEKVMRQLYHGMRGDDVHTYCMVGRYQENLPEDVEVIYTSFLGRAETTARGGALRNTLVHTPQARNAIIRAIQEHHIDIVHFHNIHSNYLGLMELQEICRYCPNIVITLHDMWAFTGGCAHAFGCTRWIQDTCRHCEGNESMPPFCWSHYVLSMKQRALAGQGIRFVVPSKWTEDRCRQGILRNESISTICNGISMQQFLPWNKEEMRRKYQIPTDKHILMFAANGTDNVYKGFPYLIEALRMLPDKDQYALVIVGNKEALTLDIGYELHAYGYVSAEEKLSELYAAADLFLLPSIADTSSFTAMESMASGTPVLAFATGGIPEIVTDEVGWTVAPRDTDALAGQILHIFDREYVEEYRARQAACRPRIEALYNENVMLQNYRDLYDEMLRAQHGGDTPWEHQ